MKPLIYTVGPTCVRCTATKKAMIKFDIPFTEIDLSQSPERASEIADLGFTTAPVVISDLGSWQGYDPGKIRRLAVERHCSN